MTTPPSAEPPPAAPIALAEVRYSLPALLKELEGERASGAFTMAKLGQDEIGKLFKTKVSSRARIKK